MNKDGLITYKHIFKHEQVVVLLVEFLTVNDLLHLLETCKRIREILKYPEIERIILKCKAASLKKVYDRVYLKRFNIMNPVPFNNIYHMFIKPPMPPKQPKQKIAKVPQIFQKMVRRKEEPPEPSEEEERLMFETMRKRMEYEVQANQEHMMRMAPVLFRNYYEEQQNIDLRKFCPVYQAKALSRGLINFVRNRLNPN